MFVGTIIKKIKQHLYAERLNGKKYLAGGLIRDKHDPRDFTLDHIGWSLFGYPPTNTDLVLPTISVKDQSPNNTCTQASATAQKECDEKVELSEQSLTCFATADGYITGNGFASLRNIQKAIQDHGIAEKALLDGDKNNWAAYSGRMNLTNDVVANAGTHKSASFISVQGRDNILQMLDKGRTLHTGFDWYSGFNMGGGFSAPWLITKSVGSLVGGHALLLKGYKMNYQGRKVYVIQNSYGKDWGDNGTFYVDMDYFDQNTYGCWAQIDIAVDTVKFLQQYAGKAVKVAGQPAIYLIKDGKKLPFTSMLSFFAYGFAPKGYSLVDSATLQAIPDGNQLSIENSPYYQAIKTVADLTKADEIIAAVEKATNT